MLWAYQDADSSGSHIDFMSNASDSASARSQQASQLDKQISALHSRLDSLTKALAEKKPKPNKVNIKPEHTPLPPCRPMPPHHMMHMAGMPHQGMAPHHGLIPHPMPSPPPAQRRMHDPLRHRAVHLHSVEERSKHMRSKRHAGHPLLDQDGAASLIPPVPSQNALPEVLGKPKNTPRPKLNMHEVAAFISSFRKKVCPSNPGGEFAINLGLHPDTGKLSVINSKNGFSVTIKCGKSQDSFKVPRKKKGRKVHEIVLNRKGKTTGHLGKNPAHHSPIHNPHPKVHHKNTQTHNDSPHQAVHHEPHRVLIDNDHGPDIGLHNTINPPRPTERPE